MSVTTEKKTLTVKKANGIAEVHIHVNKSNSYDLEYYKELNAA
ncbi:hypothetical protein SAMN05192534_14515, partial [Alteribacillus persepolensis]